MDKRIPIAVLSIICLIAALTMLGVYLMQENNNCGYQSSYPKYENSNDKLKTHIVPVSSKNNDIKFEFVGFIDLSEKNNYKFAQLIPKNVILKNSHFEVKTDCFDLEFEVNYNKENLKNVLENITISVTYFDDKSKKSRQCYIKPNLGGSVVLISPLTKFGGFTCWTQQKHSCFDIFTNENSFAITVRRLAYYYATNDKEQSFQRPTVACDEESSAFG